MMDCTQSIASTTTWVYQRSLGFNLQERYLWLRKDTSECCMIYSQYWRLRECQKYQKETLPTAHCTKKRNQTLYSPSEDSSKKEQHPALSSIYDDLLNKLTSSTIQTLWWSAEQANKQHYSDLLPSKRQPDQWVLTVPCTLTAFS